MLRLRLRLGWESISVGCDILHEDTTKEDVTPEPPKIGIQLKQSLQQQQHVEESERARAGVRSSCKVVVVVVGGVAAVEKRRSK